MKFGISFTATFLNQANALINILKDGSVQVSTGGTEMGQGLTVKIRQIVAEELGVPSEQVKYMTTSTEKNHNTSPTAASAGTDLNGMAAANACQAIRSVWLTLPQNFSKIPKLDFLNLQKLLNFRREKFGIGGALRKNNLW